MSKQQREQRIYGYTRVRMKTTHAPPFRKFLSRLPLLRNHDTVGIAQTAMVIGKSREAGRWYLHADSHSHTRTHVYIRTRICTRIGPPTHFR